MKAARVVVLVSGAGTNLQALLDAAQDTSYGATVVAVGADRPDAGGLRRAERHGVPTFVHGLGDSPDRAAWDEQLSTLIAQHEPDLVVCAGFMRLLGPAVLQRFPNRVVNTHPALLPSFPGIDAVQQAIRHGSKVTGVTVHFVDEGVDSGPIIMQRPVTIPSSRDWNETEALIHRIKHMNPRAPQQPVHFGEVPIKDVFDLRGFNLNAKLDIDPDFLKEDEHAHAHGHDHGDALRLQHLGERERDLLGQALLDLQAAREHLGDAGELGEPDHAPVGDVADVHLWGLLAGWESG